MSNGFRQVATEQIRDSRSVNQRIIEKSMHMRALAYLAEVKASLLTRTIFEIGKSKKNLSSLNKQLKYSHNHLEAAIEERTRALTTSEEKYRALVENQGALISSFNPDTTRTFVNGAYAAFRGMRADDLIGERWIDDYPQAEQPAMLELLTSCTASSPTVGMETEVNRADGEICWIHWLFIANFDDKGEISQYQAVGLDITGRKQAEAKSRRMSGLYAAFSQCNQAILHSSSEDELFPKICCNTVLYGGMKMAWIGLLDDESLLLQPIASFGSGIDYLDDIRISVSADELSGQGPTGIAVRENRPYWCQDYMHDPLLAPWHESGASYGWGASAALPLHRKGKVIGAINLYAGEVNAFDEEVRSLLLDMAMEIDFALENFALKAEGRRAEVELVQHRNHLEELVDARTHELAEVNKRLQELDRLKSMFIASMSHELRTPMNSILGFSGLMLDGVTGEINDVQRDQLQRINNAGRHLLALITDVIDISKVEAGKVTANPKPFDLGELLAEAISIHKLAMEKKGLSFTLDAPAAIAMVTDRHRLLQCLLNLLSNAIKYSNKQGHVVLRARQSGDEVLIDVTDSGIGMSDAQLQQLFKPFVRLDSELAISAGGTGLGLYLTRKLMQELLAGTVSVSSQPGAGSCFTLRLPCNLLDNESHMEVHDA